MPTRLKPCPNNAGFTLLEILVAMAVLAVMSVMAYGGLRTVLDARASTTLRSERLAALQMTMFMLNDDLAQAVARPVTDAYGVPEPGMRGGGDDELLTITRTLPAWSSEQIGKPLQRVGYRFERGALYREVWATLDRTQQTDAYRRRLGEFEQLRIRFFDNDWTEHWAADRPPKAVEIAVTVTGLGEIKRLFFVHE